MQHHVGLATPPDRHHQSIGHELRGHVGLHRPSDHAAREQVDDRGQLEPTCGRPHIREVSNPFAVGGALASKLRSRGWLRRRFGLPLAGIGQQATPARTRPKLLEVHQSLDAMQTAGRAVGQQVVPHPAGCVRALARKLVRTLAPVSREAASMPG
jgi:hypothetical protein